MHRLFVEEFFPIQGTMTFKAGQSLFLATVVPRSSHVAA